MSDAAGLGAERDWERRAATPAAIAAFASGLLLVAAVVYQGAAIGSRGTTDVDRVNALDAEGSDFVIAAAIQSLGVLLLGAVLLYLYRATKARRPALPTVAVALALGAPILVAIVGVVFQVERISEASDLVAAGPVSEDAAAELLRGSSSEVLVGLGFGANLALGFALVLISLNAMRAGLLSRFMGIVGIVIGALFVIPLIGSPFIVQLFWTVALGILFLDRWPGGRGPAWATGEARPWPTAAEQRAEVQRRREAAGAGGKAEDAADDRLETTAARDADGGEAATASAPPGKRKRKRRR